MNEFIVIEEKAFREESEQEARKYAEECVRREGLSQVLYRRVDVIRQVQEPVFSWDSKQPAPVEQDAEWVPTVGEMVEADWANRKKSGSCPPEWRPAKILDAAGKLFRYSVVFECYPDDYYFMEPNEIRRPSAKPSEKPFVFGDKVLVNRDGYSRSDIAVVLSHGLNGVGDVRVHFSPEKWLYVEPKYLKHIE